MKERGVEFGVLLLRVKVPIVCMCVCFLKVFAALSSNLA